MGQYDHIDANLQLNDWLDARMLNAKRAVGHYDAYLSDGYYPIPELDARLFSSRLLDPAYRTGHGGRGVYDASLKYDTTAKLHGGVEAGFPPYSQVDVHARMLTEHDPNFWIGQRLYIDDPNSPFPYGAVWQRSAPRSHKERIDRLKLIQENIEGMTTRQKAITSLRNADPNLHNLASLIEGSAVQLSTSEVQKLDMQAQLARLRKYGATEAQLKPLLDALKDANSDEMISGQRQLTNNTYDALVIWGREMQRRGLDIGEFVPNPETKTPIGLVKYKMSSKPGTLGKAGGFLLGVGGVAGEIGQASRLLQGGQWGEKDGQVDVYLPNEINSPDERFRKMYQQGIYTDESGREIY